MLTAASALAGLIVLRTFLKPRRYEFRNKVVVITGGARGLGLVIARMLAHEGAKIAICSRTEHQLNRARLELQEIHPEIMAVRTDITDRRDVNHFIQEVAHRFGRIDVLINNAGIIQVGPVHHMTLEDFDLAMNVNFKGALNFIHEVLPILLMQRSGKIVNISSIGGRIAFPHLLPYVASKFALTGLSEGLRYELARYGVEVTTVTPNLMRTGSPRNIQLKGAHEKEYAWFKISDSLPLLSMEAEQAAREIIEGVRSNRAEIVPGFPAKFAILSKAIAPALVHAALTLMNNLLPKPVEDGDSMRLGVDAESSRSMGRATVATDFAALKNNEL